MGMKPLEQLDHCLLGKDARFAECRMECANCGWNDEEAERRRHIPLKWCEDGMRRKILPPRPHTDELGNGAGSTFFCGHMRRPRRHSRSAKDQPAFCCASGAWTSQTAQCSGQRMNPCETCGKGTSSNAPMIHGARHLAS